MLGIHRAFILNPNRKVLPMSQPFDSKSLERRSTIDVRCSLPTVEVGIVGSLLETAKGARTKEATVGALAMLDTWMRQLSLESSGEAVSMSATIILGAALGSVHRLLGAELCESLVRHTLEEVKR